MKKGEFFFSRSSASVPRSSASNLLSYLSRSWGSHSDAALGAFLSRFRPYPLPHMSGVQEFQDRQASSHVREVVSDLETILPPPGFPSNLLRQQDPLLDPSGGGSS